MSTEIRPNRKAEAGAATRALLIERSRALFARGYAEVGTPEIVAAVGMTRGALYHHFADKRALFAAVIEAEAADVVRRIEEAADARPGDATGAVVQGCLAFVAACRDPATRQILLVDAPAVLGWAAWRDIDARHGLGSLKRGLAACAEAGCLAIDDLDAVAHLISGALNEAVFLLADRADDAALAEGVARNVERMVRGLVGGAG